MRSASKPVLEEICPTCQILLIPSAKFLPRNAWNMNQRFKRRHFPKWQERRIPSTLLRKYSELIGPYLKRRRRFPQRSIFSLISPCMIRPSSLLILPKKVTTRLWRSSLPTRRTLLSSLSARSLLREQRRDLISNPRTTLNRHQWFRLLQTIEI